MTLVEEINHKSTRGHNDGRWSSDQSFRVLNWRNHLLFTSGVLYSQIYVVDGSTSLCEISRLSIEVCLWKTWWSVLWILWNVSSTIIHQRTIFSHSTWSTILVVSLENLTELPLRSKFDGRFKLNRSLETVLDFIILNTEKDENIRPFAKIRISRKSSNLRANKGSMNLPHYLLLYQFFRLIESVTQFGADGWLFFYGMFAFCFPELLIYALAYR